MSYSELLSQTQAVSFETIMQISAQVLPKDKQQAPWLGLSHGVKLLENEDELAQYMCAYGIMHKEKMDQALQAINDTSLFLNKEITIIDWGCGQGLATICFFDYMHKLGIVPNIKQVLLVEPSNVALDRAILNLGRYIDSSKITPVNKVTNDVTTKDISVSSGLTIHFFSNILDIKEVNLDLLYSTIEDAIKIDQLFFCVGPNNQGASKINEFANLFNLTDKELLGSESGNLKSRGTINMLVFGRKGQRSEVVKVEYIHNRRIDIDNNILLLRVLSDIKPSADSNRNVLQFYKAVIDLERKKSAKVTDSYLVPLHSEIEDGYLKLNIDIQENPDFEAQFIFNFDAAHNRWPKNLNIGIGVVIDNVVYRLLQYVYPQEDLRQIDIRNQYVSVKLSEFCINPDVAEKLGLGEDIIEQIESLIKDKNCLQNDLEKILQDGISNDLVLNKDELTLALTSEEVALSQAHAELRSLLSTNRLQGRYTEDLSPLLTNFLSGVIKSNTADNIEPDSILSVVNMDESQRMAIATALNSKVSVITGPPGSGKTQMILNLLVNAIAKGKKVLVASKNNKAIDNIKDRYDRVDNFEYLLRFGSREAVRNNLIPYLDDLLTKIPNVAFDSDAHKELIAHYEYLCKIISSCRKKLDTYARIKDELIEDEAQLACIISEKTIVQEEFNQKREGLDIAYGHIMAYANAGNISWQDKRNQFKQELNILHSKESALSKLLFNLFKKKKTALQILNMVLTLPAELSRKIEESTNISDVKDVKNIDQLINLCTKSLDAVEEVNVYKGKVSSLSQNYEASKKELEGKEKTFRKAIDTKQSILEPIERSYDSILEDLDQSRTKLSKMGNTLLNSIILSKLKSPSSTNFIAHYKNYLPENIPWRNEDLDDYYRDAKNFLNVFSLNSVTSLSIKRAYPLKPELFDMIIVDEASQCDVASAIPLLQRTKQFVVVGDPLQLRHITCITSEEENAIKDKLSIMEKPLVHYANKSLWDYCQELITSSSNLNHPVVLDSHYRCHPQIIGYSNEYFYSKRLGITLNIESKERHPEIEQKGIIWVDVKGEQKSDSQNVNELEVKKCIELASSLHNQYPDISIGIISPFKHQAQEINSKMPDKLKDIVVADTVHKFQGDECDVIIYSLVITDNSPETKLRWIDYGVPNLVNVAVTRARTTLYILGNKYYITNKSYWNRPLGALVEYVEGKSTIVTNSQTKTYIIDTNVFVNCPDILSRINPRDNIIISAKVVDELDKLKITLDEESKQNATKALRNINNSFGQLHIRMECADFHYLPADFSKNSADNMILSVVMKYRNQHPILLTSDNGLLLKAKGLRVKTITLKQFLNN